jgi:alkylation response protein AidB-like acyl-CoA dehydrogenase
MIVDLNPSEDQSQIVDSIESLLSRALPMERLRAPDSFGGAAERAAWNDLSEIGLFGLGLADLAGGMGYGLPEEILAARSLGRRCISPTVLATMLAVHLACASGDSELGRDFTSGATRAAFANPLRGARAHLLDSIGCDWLLVLAAPLRLIPTSATAGGTRIACLDESIDLVRVESAEESHREAELGQRASLMLAAYLVGIAQSTLAMATAYASTREQFGQPIGAFQAIKHSCADMAVRAAGAEAQCFYAAVTSREAGSAVDVACARWLAREAAVTNAKSNIQIHGAMGFTAECDAHLYLKRALVAATLGSTVQSEEEQILGRQASSVT